MKMQSYRWCAAWMLVMGLGSMPYASGQNVMVETNAPTVRKARSSLLAAEQKLLGKHKFSLQWISWERFGVAEVKRGRNGLEINAKQSLNGDWVTVRGTVEVIDERAFLVTGQIITKVYHINNGQPCERSGTYEFRATGNRKYWRMQQMDNPCDSATDYVDVFF